MHFTLICPPRLSFGGYGAQITEIHILNYK